MPQMMRSQRLVELAQARVWVDTACVPASDASMRCRAAQVR